MFTFPQENGLYFLGGENQVEPQLEANGAGKSSLWEALHWCLFGTTGAGVKVSALTTWGVDALTSVATSIDVDGTVVIVKRTGPPSKLFIDDKPCEKNTLETLIGLNELKFQTSVLFSQGQRLFSDLTIPERGALLEDVLNVSWWARCSDATGTVIADIERELNSIGQQVSQYTGRLEGLPTSEESQLKINMWEAARKERLSNLSIQANEWEAKHTSDLLAGALAVSAEQKKRADDIAACRAQDVVYRENLEQQCDKVLQALEFQQQSSVTVDVDGARETKIKCTRDVRDLTEAVRKFESRIHTLKNEIVSFANRNCPLCEQRLPNEKADARLAAAKLELAEIEERLTAAQKTLALAATNESAAIAILETALQADGANKEHEKHVAGLQQEAKALLDKLDAKSSHLEMAEFLEKQPYFSVSLLESMQLQTNPHTALIAAAQAEINPWEAEATRVSLTRFTLETELNAKQKERESLRTKFDVYSYWKNGFKRLRLFLVHRVLAALEVECNAAANTLGLVGWKIGLVSATETKSETIKLGVQIQVASPQSQEFVPWESWSGGEAQRLKLAIALGVARLIQRAAGIHWQLEVFDEPTQHLSALGVEKLMESLDYRADATQKRIFVVDHAALTYANFKTIYRAVKTVESGTLFS